MYYQIFGRINDLQTSIIFIDYQILDRKIDLYND